MEPTQRFSDRVDDYTRYRPGYPPACLEFLVDTFKINALTSIADVGSGTGTLTRLLLETGASVCAVEPNENMRAEAETQLKRYPRFASIKGKGEATNLADHSMDLVTVAQAFHWLDAVSARKEFHRILKPGGHVVMLWNIRLEGTPFMRSYEMIKEKYGKDYIAIRRSHEPDLRSFFHPKKNKLRKFPHFLLLNEEGLHGQIRSSSFMPAAKDPAYAAMQEEVNELFHHYQENGLVRVDYETQVHYSA